MEQYVGRPVKEALSSLPEGVTPPRVIETAAPRKDGRSRREGALRVVACREGQWIAARFPDAPPREKEEEP